MTRYWTSQALLLTVLVFLQTSLAKADSVPEIVAKAKPAIVEIVTEDATGNPKTLGTGFFVSPGRVGGDKPALSVAFGIFEGAESGYSIFIHCNDFTIQNGRVSARSDLAELTTSRRAASVAYTSDDVYGDCRNPETLESKSFLLWRDDQSLDI